MDEDLEVVDIDIDNEKVEGYEHPEEDEDAADMSDEHIPRWKRSACPKHKDGHDPVMSTDERGHPSYKCSHCHKIKWTGSELELIADTMLREDSNAELCRVCRDKDPNSLPYGKETGHIEWQIQKDKDGNVLLDSEDNALYVAFPELRCPKGHRWYKGEGPRRNINGVNPILFETHIYNRKRREIYVKEGIPDPAYTMDRWGKRPTPGQYYRTHPLGRKTNSQEQRARNGASYYK
jgi:hypothetical protein